ncbi:MAG: hypothetical protein H0X12_14550 [Nocardioides sp.]|nr:hypothetical protein [Nocardioides sp.]
MTTTATATTTLCAALDIATGESAAALKPRHRHRHQEFLAFLKQIERAYRNVLDENGVFKSVRDLNALIRTS